MVEALTSVSLKPRELEVFSQGEFMSPEEFDFITTEHLISVKFDELSDQALERGRKGDLTPDEKMSIVGGGLVVTPKYSIILGSQLSRDERGIALLEFLDIIRRNEDIKKNGSKKTTFEEEVRRESWVVLGSYNFYYTNQEMVNKFLDRGRKVWGT